MTREEAISFGTDRLELFGGQMEEFIKLSVEALKEQRPKGHWICHYDEDEKVGWYECDRCYTERAFNTNFCPDCGADMREVTE